MGVAVALVGVVLVPGPAGGAGEPVRFAQVFAGGAHSAGLTADGFVFTWGYNALGQLGVGDQATRDVPTFVAGFPERVTSLALGHTHTLALTESGTVWGWGDRPDGKAAGGDAAVWKTPRIMTGLPASDPVERIWAGAEASAAVTKSGRTIFWGCDTSSLVAAGSAAVESELNKVGPVVDLTLFFDDAAAVTKSGRLYTWGANYDGQAGLGDTASHDLPTFVSGLSGVIAVGAGDYHTMALTSTGQVWIWGDNKAYALGGTDDVRLVPGLLDGLPAGTQIGAIAAGMATSFAVTKLGALYSWGANSFGELGQGHAGPGTKPALISIAPVEQVAAGLGHVVALSKAGEAWAWGYNENGQLAVPGVANTTAPVRLTPAAKSTGSVTGSLSATTIEVGSEVVVDVKASASPKVPLAGATVTASGGAISASAPLASDASARLVLRNLPVGTHTITVSYSGSGISTAATTVVGQVLVKQVDLAKPAPPAKPKVAIVLKKKKVAFGKAVKATIKVTSGKKKVSGKVVLRWGKKKRTLTLKNGKATTKIKGLKAGKHTLKAEFRATKKWAGAKSKSVKVTVAKPKRR